MLKTPLISVAMLLSTSLALAAAPPATETLSPFEGQSLLVAEQSKLDSLVFTRLNTLGIRPANLCSDATFVRRVYLDTIGTLPTAEETRSFLDDPNPRKRQKLVDKLLERDEFADYWALKWGDLLRVKAEFPVCLWPNAAQAYSRWIHTAIKENRPYDLVARQLLTASGSNFRDAPANFYRAFQGRNPATIAQTVALTFMGTRTDAWPKERLAGLAAFFSQVGYKSTTEWKEEIVFFDPSKPLADKPTFPDGTAATLAPGQDPREAFANWLTTPDNPYFTRAIANRVWSWLLGRGIIEPADDIRPDNPPSNPQLLAYLQQELIASHYDLKHLYRLILNSQTYQLSCLPQSTDPQAAAQFAAYPLRRLDAEVLIDALCQITQTTEKYSSPIPEPFTFYPESKRTITLPDGSITSPFLEMFGRATRDTGMESDRNNKPSAEQRLHMLNSTHIQKKLEQCPLTQSSSKAHQNPRETINTLYLTILSRYPTPSELVIAERYLISPTTKGRDGVIDLVWALINSTEFLYRH